MPRAALFLFTQGTRPLGALAHDAESAARRVGELHLLSHGLAQFPADFLHHGIVAAGEDQAVKQFLRHFFHIGAAFDGRVGVLRLQPFGQTPPHAETGQPTGRQQLLLIALQHDAHLRGGRIGHDIFRPCWCFRPSTVKL